ncbi:MAG: glycosyltransferase family 4 protein [Hyphomonadaceae bacterium]|nr:glycosyltransferase family 4 protein [Hyphomonadaceae bacterium]
MQLRYVDARPRDARRAVWSMGDIFTLPSDNIQETFGLAPVEGMAAGLPVVATDWNGFRDNIRHGEHGFLIPTFQPPNGTGAGLAYGHDAGLIDYDHYIGRPPNMSALITQRQHWRLRLCLMMENFAHTWGAAGQQYVREHLDWSHIIGQYKALFVELAANRSVAQQSSPSIWAAQRSTRQDPFALFSTYPTFKVDAQTWVEACGNEADLKREHQSSGNVVWAASMVALPQMVQLHSLIRSTGKCQIGTILSKVTQEQVVRALNGLAWMAKHNLVALSWQPAQSDRPL